MYVREQAIWRVPESHLKGPNERILALGVVKQKSFERGMAVRTVL
jgi:hypothetical protein